MKKQILGYFKDEQQHKNNHESMHSKTTESTLLLTGIFHQ